MRTRPVQSSNLKTVGYDPKTRTMEVTFQSSGTYRYQNVSPGVPRAIWRAKSPGKVFYKRIVKVNHPFEKIGTSVPAGTEDEMVLIIPSLASFIAELEKTAISRHLVEDALDSSIAHDPSLGRLNTFIQHMRPLAGAKPAKARALAVEKARNFLSGTPDFSGPRPGNPAHLTISGELTTPTKLAHPVKRQTTFEGIPIRIELEPGDLRKGKNKETGETWEKKMYASYGHIPQTKGDDGEAVDVYLAPHPQPGAQVYLIHQTHRDGSRDEDKVMLGFSSDKDAKMSYLRHVPAWCFGSMEGMTRTDFDGYLEHHSRQAQATKAIKKAASANAHKMMRMLMENPEREDLAASFAAYREGGRAGGHRLGKIFDRFRVGAPSFHDPLTLEDVEEDLPEATQTLQAMRDASRRMIGDASRVEDQEMVFRHSRKTPGSVTMTVPHRIDPEEVRQNLIKHLYNPSGSRSR